METTQQTGAPHPDHEDTNCPSFSWPSDLPAPIAAALVRAQIAAKAVAKTATAEVGKGYAYTKMEDLIEEGRGALNSVGLALIPGDMRTERFTVGEKAVVCYTLVRQWAIVHESGAVLNISISWPLYLQSGKRSRDKAVAVAATTSLGYLYRDLLGIPRLGEEQMDARDDRGTTEPGVDPQEAGPHGKSRSSKTPLQASDGRKAKFEADEKKATEERKKKQAATDKREAAAKKREQEAAKKKAAKEDASERDRVAAEKKKANEKAAADKVIADADAKAAKKKALEDELAKLDEDKPPEADTGAKAPEETEAEAERKAIAEADAKDATVSETAGTTYGGGKPSGQTPDERDEEIRKALAMGMTPSSQSEDLVGALPPDPGADDIEAAGWPADIAAELEGFDAAKTVERGSLNTVVAKAAELLGLKMSKAKPMLIPAFASLGCDLSKKQVPNGYQLRLWCIAVGGLAKAHAEISESDLPF